LERLPTWKNAKHGQQSINSRREYAFPKIGKRPVGAVDPPEVLAWQDVPAFHPGLATGSAMATHALRFTCLTGSRTGEVLGAT